MEVKSTNDCDCGSDCCQPSKSKPWTKIVFIVIVIAALAIAAMKLINNNTTDAKGTVFPGENSVSCDTISQDTCSKVCDPAKNSSCCPKATK